MSDLSLATGDCLLAITVLPWALVGRRLRRWLLPDLDRAAGALATATLAIAGVLAVAEVAGVAGVLSRWPLALGSAVIATVVAAAVPSAVTATSRAAGSSRPPLHRFEVGVLAATIAAATLQILAGTAEYLGGGIVDYDSILYHLPHAARFAQLHSLDHLQQVGLGDNNAFQPSNVELLHAVGMVELHNDFASLFVTLGFAALFLLAGWVVGTRLSSGPAGLIVTVCCLVAWPLGGLAGGTALTDIPVLALMLIAVGFVLEACGGGLTTAIEDGQIAPRHRALLIVGGAANGLAMGGKLSVLAPVLLLVAVVAVVFRKQRSSVVAFAVATVATGGFWYARNLVLTGNPLPGLGVLKTLGLPTPATSYVDQRGQSVASYLSESSVVLHNFPHGLERVFGIAWPAILLAALVGAILAMRRSSPTVLRLLGAATLIAAAAYVVTPTGASGVPHHAPLLFDYNFRYAMPWVVLGLLLLTASVAAGRARQVFVGVVTVVVVAELARRTAWPFDVPHLAVALFVLLAVGAALLWIAMRLPRLLQSGAAFGAALATLAAAVLLGHHFHQNRYAAGSDPQAALFHAAQNLHDTSIAVAGAPLSYPLYGADLSNHVQVLGQPSPHHGYQAITSCPAWRRAISNGGYRYLVTENRDQPTSPPQLTWTTSIAGAHVVFMNPAGAIVAIPATVDMANCQ